MVCCRVFSASSPGGVDLPEAHKDFLDMYGQMTEEEISVCGLAAAALVEHDYAPARWVVETPPRLIQGAARPAVADHHGHAGRVALRHTTTH
jgi:hypothetical protein